MSDQGAIPKPILALRLAAVGILTGLLALQIGASFWSLVNKSRFIPLDTWLSSTYGSFDERGRIIRDGGMKQWGEVGPEHLIGLIGLRQGDLVVAVNGVRLTDDPAAYYRVFIHGSAGDPVEFTWLRDGVEQTGIMPLAPSGGGGRAGFSWSGISLLKGEWPEAQITGFAQAFFPFGPWVALALLLLLVGSPIGWLRLHDSAAFHVSLLLLSIGMVFCMSGEMVILWPIWLITVYNLAASAGEPLLLALGPRVLADFPNRTRLGGWFFRWRWVFYLPLASLGVISCLAAIQEIQAWPSGFWKTLLALVEWIQSQTWITLVLLVWSLGMVALLLLAQRRETRGSPEARLRVVETGFLAWAMILLWILFPPTVLLWQLIRPETQALRLFLFGLHVVLPALLIACLPVAFAYAVLARRAFGIRFIVRRGLQHLFLSRGVRLIEGLLLFLLVMESIRQGRSRIGTSVPAVAGIAAGTTLLVMGAIARVNRPLMRRIDRRFFRETYDARRILLSLGEGISLLREREEIFQDAGNAVYDALHPGRIAFYLRGSKPEEVQCVWTRTAGGNSGPAGSTGTDGSGRGDRLEETAVAGLRALEEGKPWIDLPPAGRAETAAREAGGDTPCELLIALRSHSGLLGCMALAAKLSEEPFSREDKELLVTVAAQMGLAIENAELIEVAKREAEQARDLTIARQVQQNLFPKELPRAKGWEFAAICRPAKAVGGDYYDLFAIDAEHIALALGDVSGKGIGPSMLMSSAHTLIRSRLRQRGTGLADLVRELNEHLYASTSPEMFITLFVGILDLRTAELRYVNAGHNPPLVFAGSETPPARLSAGGIMVGIVPEVSFEEGTLPMTTESLLTVYSDGITEAVDAAGGMFEEARLIRVLEENRRVSASGILASVLESVDRFSSGCEQADDISLLIIRRLKPSATA
ncbi:MAG: SpoIIE family protein phosphatase [Candidatus Eisenbacteria bacterium]